MLRKMQLPKLINPSWGPNRPHQQQSQATSAAAAIPATADHRERKLLELDRQIDAHLANVVRQADRHGGEVDDPFDAGGDQAIGYALRRGRGTAIMPSLILWSATTPSSWSR